MFLIKILYIFKKYKMNKQEFFYLNHNNNINHNNDQNINNILNNISTYPVYQTYPLYFNTQLYYHPNRLNPGIKPSFSVYRPHYSQYYNKKYPHTLTSIGVNKSINKPILIPYNNSNYKHQTKNLQQKINKPNIKKSNLIELIKKINYSQILSDKFAYEKVLNEVKNNYDLNGDNYDYKKSNIYKLIHDPNIIKLTENSQFIRTPNYFNDIDKRLNIIEELIKLGAKVDYKTDYFENSILYDFMHIIELYKLNIDMYYKYRNDFYQSYIDDKLKINNLYLDIYFRVFSLLLSKNIQTKFKYDSKHTLTPLNYARKLHINYLFITSLK